VPRQPGKRRRKSKQAAMEWKAIREVPGALREKARERLSNLPEPLQWAVQAAEEAAGLLFAPLRIGMRVTRELLAVPAAMIRLLRHREG